MPRGIKKTYFTIDMLRKDDVLINRNGDIKEWRGADGKAGHLYETYNNICKYGRGANTDLLTNQINSRLQQQEGFKVYDIIKVIRQGVTTHIND